MPTSSGTNRDWQIQRVLSGKKKIEMHAFIKVIFNGVATDNHFFSRPEALLRENIKCNEIGKMLEQEQQQFPAGDLDSRREYHPFSRQITTWEECWYFFFLLYIFFFCFRGFMLNEIFRRRDPSHRTVGEWVEQEVRQRLDAAVHIGAGDEEEAERLLGRTARVGLWDSRWAMSMSMLPWWADGRMPMGPRETARRVRMVNSTAAGAARKNPVPWFDAETPMSLRASVEMTRDRSYLRGEVPSANGLCSARGMAKVTCGKFKND